MVLYVPQPQKNYFRSYFPRPLPRPLPLPLPRPLGLGVLLGVADEVAGFAGVSSSEEVSSELLSSLATILVGTFLEFTFFGASSSEELSSEDSELLLDFEDLDTTLADEFVGFAGVSSEELSSEELLTCFANLRLSTRLTISSSESLSSELLELLLFLDLRVELFPNGTPETNGK